MQKSSAFFNKSPLDQVESGVVLTDDLYSQEMFCKHDELLDGRVFLFELGGGIKKFFCLECYNKEILIYLKANYFSSANSIMKFIIFIC